MNIVQNQSLKIIPIALFVTFFVSGIEIVEPRAAVTNKKRDNYHLSSLCAYLPTEHFWGAGAAYVLGGVGSGASEYCTNNKIKHVRGVCFVHHDKNFGKSSWLVPLQGTQLLALPLVWVGWIVKYKRYAYLPACISLMIPHIPRMLFEWYATAAGSTDDRCFLYRCCQSFGPGSAFHKDQHTICLMLLAAGYAYETYQEEKRNKAVRNDEFFETIDA